MISRTAEYAIRAMVSLRAHKKETPMLTRAVSEETGIPANYLSKILHVLGRAGLVSSARGPGGGFFLHRPPDEITVFDIVALFEDLESEPRCLLGQSTCGDDGACQAHDRWKRVGETYQDFLRNTTLAQLAPGGE